MNAGPKPTRVVRGVAIFGGFLDREAQAALVRGLFGVAEAAPFVRPVTRWGRPMSVRMTSAGTFGWVSTPRGYAYARAHPSGARWPAIPAQLLDIWRRVSGSAREPECCLVNHYGEGARMGLHQDRDEADFDEPVVSVSLGDEALFRIGNTSRGGPTESLWLKSGDVVVMGGAARLTYHGVDRIRFGSSDLLPGHGRLNVTMRVVT